jgi:hypothetical protein
MILKKPSIKNAEAIQEVMEESLKAKCFAVKTEGVLTSLLFPGDTSIPKDMPALREELESRQYLMFYSYVIYKSVEVLSLNICKFCTIFYIFICTVT